MMLPAYVFNNGHFSGASSANPFRHMLWLHSALPEKKKEIMTKGPRKSLAVLIASVFLYSSFALVFPQKV